MHMIEKEIDNIELRDKIISHLNTRLQKNELSNNDMIAIIELIGSYCNCATISDYAKQEKISYNGVLDRISKEKIKTVNIFNVKFVIDNE